VYQISTVVALSVSVQPNTPTSSYEACKSHSEPLRAIRPYFLVLCSLSRTVANFDSHSRSSIAASERRNFVSFG